MTFEEASGIMWPVSVASVRLTMHGPPGSIGLGAFGQFLEHFQGLTSAVARDRGIEGATWRVTELGTGSAVVEAAIDIPVDGLALASDLVIGIHALHDEPKIPEVFGVRALPSAAKMGKAAEDNPVRVEVVQAKDRVEARDLAAVVDIAVARNARKAMKATRQSLGGYYGQITLLDVRKANKFGLHDEFSRRWIPCYTTDDRIMDEAKRAIVVGTRVFVAGEITENSARQPLRIRVDSIEPQPWVGTSVDRFVGVARESDVTERSAAEIIREQRDW